MKVSYLVGSATLGAIGSVAFGGWDGMLVTLLIFMALDFVSGLTVAALGKSPKSGTGKLSSSASFEGLIKKGLILFVPIIGHRVDIVLNQIGVDSDSYVLTGVCLALVLNECISILENLNKGGVKIPKVLLSVIEKAKEKEN